MNLNRINRTLQCVVLAVLSALLVVSCINDAHATPMFTEPPAATTPAPRELVPQPTPPSDVHLLIAHCDQGECFGNMLMKYEALFSLSSAARSTPQLHYTGRAAIGLRAPRGPAIGLRV